MYVYLKIDFLSFYFLFYNMDNQEQNLLVYCFVSTSTCFLWGLSYLFLPTDRLLHFLNLCGVCLHSLYHLFFYPRIIDLYALFKMIDTIVHLVYIFQIGFYFFLGIATLQLVSIVILARNRFSQSFVYLWIAYEIAIRCLYMSSYILLSYTNDIFYFSGYIKTI
jgi:hypothetical protein